MAKSGRHKKLRKQEKAKTQLKGGKTLAKAQNVVEPKLRAKKILIREQLKSPSSSALTSQIEDSEDEVQSVDVTTDATTRRKQSIQDVLSSLNHHNKNIKKDALSGLVEIVTSQNSLLLSNLDKILEKLGALTSDLEGIVRKENIRVSEIIFAQVKEEQIHPFWNLLLTHVKCTLTNLNPHIRYKCLSFLTLLINYFPNLTANSNHIILPNLLGLISTSSSVQQPSNSSKSTTSASKSKLRIEISSQHNDSKERLRVLSLIASCLALEKKRANVSTSSGSSTIHFDWDNYNANTLYFPSGYEEFQNHDHLKYSLNELILSGTSCDKDANNFWPAFIQSCLPVLWETWVEFMPSLKDENVKSGGRGVSSLSSLAVEYLECIVVVMRGLVLHQEHNSNTINIAPSNAQSDEGGNDLARALRKNHGQNLKKYFLNSLPYSAMQETQRKMVTSVNLDLFHIAAGLKLVDDQLMTSLENYIRGLLGRTLLDAGQTQKVLEILTLIRMERTGNVLSEVIDYALDSEQHESVNSFLLQALTPTTSNLNTMDNFIVRAVDWNNVINQLLVGSPSLNSETLQILTLIGLRKLCDFSVCLEDNFIKIQNFLKQENDSLDAWDLVLRLFYVMNRVEYLKRESIVLPEAIHSVINQLVLINESAD